MEGSFVIDLNNSHRYINDISDSIQLHFHFDVDLNSASAMSLLFKVFDNDTQTYYSGSIPGFTYNSSSGHYYKSFHNSTDYLLNLNFPFNYSLDFYKYDSLNNAVVSCNYYSTSTQTGQFLSTISVPMSDTANLSNLGGVLFTSLQFVLPLVAAYFAFRYIYNKVRKRFRGAGV